MNALLPVRVQGVPQGEERVTVLVHHRKEVVLQSVRDRQLSHGLSRQHQMMDLHVHVRVDMVVGTAYGSVQPMRVHLRRVVARVLCAAIVRAGAGLVWMMRCPRAVPHGPHRHCLLASAREIWSVMMTSRALQVW